MEHAKAVLFTALVAFVTIAIANRVGPLATALNTFGNDPSAAK